jgi:hypothetical protein
MNMTKLIVTFHNFGNMPKNKCTVTKVFFYSSTDALLLILGNSKIYIKTYIKIAPTCFGLRPSSGSLLLSLAKVTLVLKQSVKLRSFVLCGGVAACYVQVWCVCCVPCRVSLILPHNTRRRNFTDCFNISVTLARLKCKLPDNGCRPKHVGAILI